MIPSRSFPRAAIAASILIALCAIAETTLAQGAPAQAPAPAAPNPVVLPKPDCGTKPEHPGGLASDRQKRQWRKDATAYIECYNKYVTEQRALAQRYQDAANIAIGEYNSTVKEMQAAIDAAAQ